MSQCAARKRRKCDELTNSRDNSRLPSARRRLRAAGETGGGTDLLASCGTVGLGKYVVAQRGPRDGAGKVVEIHCCGQGALAGAALQNRHQPVDEHG
jgi:hypothetical protein